MAIQFNCANCKKTLQAANEQAGATVSCPGCQTRMQVPYPQAEAVEENKIELVEEVPSRSSERRRDRYDRDDEDDSPRRGKPAPGNKLWYMIGGAGAIFLICCGGPLMFMGMIGVGAKVKEEQGAKKVSESQDAIKVSAVELFLAFKNNEVSANQKYKDKVVELTGTVHAVKERFVELNEDNTPFILGLVHVQFEGKSKDKMASLNKGQSIRAKGLCAGKSFAWVEITNAQMVEGVSTEKK